MKKIYISGPMTGYQDFNFPAFNIAERKLEEEGYTDIINPASFGYKESYTWEDYIVKDMRAISTCREMYFLPKWKESKGARFEKSFYESIIKSDENYIVSDEIMEYNKIINKVTKPHIIAVTGRKRSGKDTIAKYLVTDFGFVRYAFADPIKEACKAIFGWTEEHVNGKLKEVVDTDYGISPRKFMQLLGTEIMQFELPKLCQNFSEVCGRFFWVKRFKKDFKSKIINNDYRNVVISDLRFQHEIEGLMELNKQGFPVTLLRVSRDTGLNQDDIHASEKDIDNLKVDHSLTNEESIFELHKQVEELLDYFKIR